MSETSSLCVKQIFLHRYKSYREMSYIEPLSKGINLIIGSNGHGKSNFLDSILYVLSDKYHGLSPEQKRLLVYADNMSENNDDRNNKEKMSIEVVLDNKSRRFPLDTDQISIQKSFLCSTKSEEYLINQKKVIKSDILNYFESAGFSMKNPYYIIQQGKIMRLLNMSDSEYFEIFSNVIGTKVYEEKKSESLELLKSNEETKTKIIKQREVIETHIKKLEDQYEDLKQYTELEKDRKTIEYYILNEKLNMYNTGNAFLEDKLKSERNEMKNITQNYNGKRAEINNALKEIEKIKNESYNFNERISKLKLKLLEEEEENSNSNQMNSIQNSKYTHISNLDLNLFKGNTIDELDQKLFEYNDELNKLNIKKKNIFINLQKYKNDIQSLEYDLESKKKSHSELKNKNNFLLLDSPKEKNNYAQNQINSFTQEIKQINEFINEKKNLINESSNALVDIENNLDQTNKESNLISGNIKVLNDKLASLSQERSDLENKRKKNEIESNELSEQKYLVEQDIENLIKTFPNQNIFKAVTKLLNLKIKGVFGLLIDAMQVTDLIENAVDILLKDKLYSIIVDTIETSKILLAENKRINGPVINIIPLEFVNIGENTYLEDDDAEDYSMFNDNNNNNNNNINNNNINNNINNNNINNNSLFNVNGTQFSGNSNFTQSQHSFNSSLNISSNNINIINNNNGQKRYKDSKPFLDYITVNENFINSKIPLSNSSENSICKQKIKKIINDYFSKCYIVRNIEVANAYAKSYNLTCVTGQNEVIYAGGFMSRIGYYDFTKQRIQLFYSYLALNKKREDLIRNINDLEGKLQLSEKTKIGSDLKIRELFDKRSENNIKLDSLNKKLENLKEEKDKKLNEKQNLEEEISKNKQNINDIENKISNLKNFIKNLNNKNSQLNINDLDDTNKQIIELEKRILEREKKKNELISNKINDEALLNDEIQPKIKDIETKINLIKINLETKKNLKKKNKKNYKSKEEYMEDNDDEDEIKTHSDLENNKRTNKNNEDENENENEDEINTKSNFNDNMTSSKINTKKIYNSSINQYLKKIKENDKLLSDLRKKLDILNSQLKEIQNEMRKKQSVLEEFSLNQKELTENIKTIKLKIGELSVVESSLTGKLKKLQKNKLNCTQEVSMSLKEQDQILDKTLELVLNKLKEVNENIKKFENINRFAREEHENFRNKAEEIDSKLEEINNEKEKIESLIQEIDNKNERNTLNLFDNFNQRFEEFFTKLTVNGKCKITLNYKEKTLHIDASFDGKEEFRQKIYQMSGGQKTAIGIALIFALSTIEPPPFYILDEIDASLDPDFRSKLALLIKELSQNNQFIISTFKPEFIDVADSIYFVKYANATSNIAKINKDTAKEFLNPNI